MPGRTGVSEGGSGSTSAWAAAMASASATGSIGVSSGALLLPSPSSLDSLSLLSRSTPSAPSYPACKETEAETWLARLACHSKGTA